MTCAAAVLRGSTGTVEFVAGCSPVSFYFVFADQVQLVFELEETKSNLMLEICTWVLSVVVQDQLLHHILHHSVNFDFLLSFLVAGFLTK